jgi:hypothetical protein
VSWLTSTSLGNMTAMSGSSWSKPGLPITEVG